MIGLSFLIRLAMVAFYVVVFLFLLYVVIFAITWGVRLFVDRVGSSFGDHAQWLKSKLPRITFRK